MLGQRKKNIKETKIDNSKKQWEIDLETDEKAIEIIPAPESDSEFKHPQARSESEERDFKSRGADERQEKFEQVQKKAKKYEWMDSDDDIEIQTDSDEIKSEKQDYSAKHKEELPKHSEKKGDTKALGDSLAINSDDVKNKDLMDTRTIFINNLPFDLSNKEIDNLFKKYGKIISMEVPKNEGSIVNKGRAFIEYSSVEEAQKAVNSKTIWAKGRELQVTLGLSNATTMMAQTGKKPFPAKRQFKTTQRSNFQEKRQKTDKRRNSGSDKSISRSRSRSKSNSRKRKSSSSSSKSSRSSSNSSRRSTD